MKHSTGRYTSEKLSNVMMKQNFENGQLSNGKPLGFLGAMLLKICQWRINELIIN